MFCWMMYITTHISMNIALRQLSVAFLLYAKIGHSTHVGDNGHNPAPHPGKVFNIMAAIQTTTTGISSKLNFQALGFSICFIFSESDYH